MNEELENVKVLIAGRKGGALGKHLYELARPAVDLSDEAQQKAHALRRSLAPRP